MVASKNWFTQQTITMQIKMCTRTVHIKALYFFILSHFKLVLIIKYICDNLKMISHDTNL